MPATSEKQRRAAGMALNAKRGGPQPDPGGAAASMMSMTTSQLRDFASKRKPQSAPPVRGPQRDTVSPGDQPGAPRGAKRDTPPPRRGLPRNGGF